MSHPDTACIFTRVRKLLKDNNDLIMIALHDLGALLHLKGSVIGVKNIIRG